MPRDQWGRVLALWLPVGAWASRSPGRGQKEVRPGAARRAQEEDGLSRVDARSLWRELPVLQACRNVHSFVRSFRHAIMSSGDSKWLCVGTGALLALLSC